MSYTGASTVETRIYGRSGCDAVTAMCSGKPETKRDKRSICAMHDCTEITVSCLAAALQVCFEVVVKASCQ